MSQTETFFITYEPAYFSKTCFCNIPSHWIAESDDGVRYDGFSEADVRQTVIRFHPGAEFVYPRSKAA